MEAVNSYETSASSHQTTRHKIPEDYRYHIPRIPEIWAFKPGLDLLMACKAEIQCYPLFPKNKNHHKSVLTEIYLHKF